MKQFDKVHSNTGLVVGNLGPNGVINFLDNTASMGKNSKGVIFNFYNDDEKDSKYNIDISNCTGVTTGTGLTQSINFNEDYETSTDDDYETSTDDHEFILELINKNEKTKKEKERVIPEGTDEKVKENYEDNTNCIICFENVRSLTIDNCGHFCCCYGCADKIVKTSNLCPVCREKIVKFRKTIIV